MTSRANPFTSAPEMMQGLIHLGNAVASSGLEPALIELVKIRASQINGCALCLHMHTHEARKRGESEERLYLLDAWRETSFYTPRERAALAWTEWLTRLSEKGSPGDDLYRELKAHFSDEEQMKLTMMIVVINGFNRVNVAFQRPPMTREQLEHLAR